MSSWLSDSGLIAEETQNTIHDGFTSVYMRTADEPFETLAGELRALLIRHEGELQADPAAFLELRRRVAEATLTVAIGKKRPVAECERLLDEAASLGWSDLHRRAQVQAMFCGYGARRGSRGRVLRYLQPLIADLEAEHARTGEAIWANHLRACQDIRARIEGRGR